MVKDVTTRYGWRGGGGGGRRREGEETIKGGGKEKAGKEEVKRTQCCGNKVKRSEADTVLRKQSQWTEDLQTPTHWPGSNRRLKPELRWPTYQSFFVSSSQEANAVRVDDFAP